jgi:hypothetical protein
MEVLMELLAELQAVLRMIVSWPEARAITVGVLLNTSLAVAIAIRRDEFDFRRLWQFLWNRLTPYLITYGVARLVADGTEWAWVTPAVFAVLQVSLAGDIVAKLQDLGIPIPPSAQKLLGNGKNGNGK